MQLLRTTLCTMTTDLEVCGFIFEILKWVSMQLLTCSKDRASYSAPRTQFPAGSASEPHAVGPSRAARPLLFQMAACRRTREMEQCGGGVTVEAVSPMYPCLSLGLCSCLKPSEPRTSCLPTLPLPLRSLSNSSPAVDGGQGRRSWKMACKDALATAEPAIWTGG